KPADAGADFIAAHEAELAAPTDVELALIAQAAAGRRPDSLLARLRAVVRPDGAIGPSINSTVWGVIALRAAREPVPPATVRWILARQTRSGGWSWGA